MNVRKDSNIANYLFEKLKKDSLLDVFKCVNDGLLKQECGFNDSLLFLCKLINNDQFNKNVSQIADDCLSNKSKTIKSRNFFK